MLPFHIIFFLLSALLFANCIYSKPSIKLLAITGRKFNGKDTAGDFLVKKYGFKKFSFAEPLKKACIEIFGFDPDQVYGIKKDTIDTYWQTTPRDILSFIGTDLLRNQLHLLIPDLKEDIWLKSMERRIKKEWTKNPNQKIVITDLRFENEIILIKRLGGKIIRVKRDIPSNSINNIDCHSSEKFIDNLQVDYDIENNGSKRCLFNKLRHFLHNTK